jgi:pyruvate ferredoxin oxidoreductase gamma subunit
MPEVREIIFYGKSGDGIHLLVDRLVQELIKRGFYVIAYPEYDPERRETIARIHVRISRDPIYERGPVTKPEVAVLMDARLLRYAEEALNAGKLIVNAPSEDLLVNYLNGNARPEIHIINLDGLKRGGIDYALYMADLVMKTLNL